MPRPCIPVLAIACLLALTGCEDRVQTSMPMGYAYQDHAWTHPPEARQPSLLFDRIPGQPTASAFAFRSDWPSTSTGRQAAETLYYMTYVNDRQGYGWYNHGYYHRSARYYLVGREER